MRYLIFILLLASTVHGQTVVDVYVNTDTGNDSTGTGASGTPWASCARAVQGSEASDLTVANEVYRVNLAGSAVDTTECDISSSFTTDSDNYVHLLGDGTYTLQPTSGTTGAVIVRDDYTRIENLRFAMDVATAEPTVRALGGDHLVVIGNVFLAPQTAERAFENFVQGAIVNNFFRTGHTAVVELNSGATGSVLFAGNSIAGCNDGTGCVRVRTDISGSTYDIYNNLCSNNSSGKCFDRSGSINGTFNIGDNVTDDSTTGSDDFASSTISNITFDDETSGLEDLHITGETDVAIVNAGTDISALLSSYGITNNDIDGDSRTVASPDVGADEQVTVAANPNKEILLTEDY